MDLGPRHRRYMSFNNRNQQSHLLLKVTQKPDRKEHGRA